jgi:hypothetical protein
VSQPTRLLSPSSAELAEVLDEDAAKARALNDLRAVQIAGPSKFDNALGVMMQWPGCGQQFAAPQTGKVEPV